MCTPVQGVEAVLNGIKNDTATTLAATRGQEKDRLQSHLQNCVRLCRLRSLAVYGHMRGCCRTKQRRSRRRKQWPLGHLQTDGRLTELCSELCSCRHLRSRSKAGARRLPMLERQRPATRMQTPQAQAMHWLGCCVCVLCAVCVVDMMLSGHNKS